MKVFSEELKRRKTFEHQYYLGPVNQFLLSTSNLCSKQHKAVQIFRWESYTLIDEISNRKEEGK